MATDVTTRPQYLNANTNIYTAWDLRSHWGDVQGAGVAGYQDFRVLPRQAGANMSVDVGAAGTGLMAAFVRGSTRGGQGLYRVDNADRGAPTADTYLAQLNVVVSANASGNPRLDQVVLVVGDQQHAGSLNKAYIDVIAGTPTGGATLDNRTGAAVLPASSILLADVIVANGESTIDAVDIRDRRAFTLRGVIPPLLTDRDEVAFELAPGLDSEFGAVWVTGTDNQQTACLMYLPRRITSATRIRWKYQQGAIANANSYNLAVVDASGRLIVATGAVAAIGVAGSAQERSETITATTFEAGWYYVWAGLATVTGGSSMLMEAASPGPGGSAIIPSRNIAFRTTGGGTTFPSSNTILGYTDVASLTGATVIGYVPRISLSVG